jgi:hypothetical protein
MRLLNLQKVLVLDIKLFIIASDQVDGSEVRNLPERILLEQRAVLLVLQRNSDRHLRKLFTLV